MAITQVSQGNAPKNINMNHFKSFLNQSGSLVRACRFLVSIKSPTAIKSAPKELYLLCDAAELPGRGFATVETRYYGPSQMFPTNSQYQPASFSFLCRNASGERRYFDDWLEVINPSTNYNFEYFNNYQCDIDVYQYSEYGGQDGMPQVTYHWQLRRAWPMLVAPQAVSWEAQDILRLQVTFAYKNWERPTLQ
jgi:hypothetical protein